jgi:peptidoglycan hydrolase CwlO-like protein
MNPVSPRQQNPRLRGGRLALAAAVFASLLALGGHAGVAPAENLDRQLHRGQARLDRVEQRSSAVSASIEQQNREIDALIGQVAALQSRRAAVEQELAAKQAELDRATAALERQRRHLEVVRGQLKRALKVLRRWLVTVYVSGNPDVLSVIANSASWSDVVSQSEYLGQIRDYEGTVVRRVQEIRDQTRAAVKRLTETRQQISDARDAIAAEEEQLAGMEATLQARHSELEAAQSARQQALDSLQGKADALRNNLSSVSDQIAQRRAAAEQQAAAPAPAPGVSAPAPTPASVPGESATLLPNGQAAAPASAPAAVKAVIAAANSIATTPYIWGGGHGSFSSPGYDCSGAVSFALNGGGFLSSPLDSTGLETWGVPGAGSWITVYANSGHAFAVIAGLRWDTSGDVSGSGPRWHTDMASTAGFIARHPSGY